MCICVACVCGCLCLCTHLLSIIVCINILPQKKAEIQHELSATSDHQRRQLEQELSTIEWKISDSVQRVQNCEENIQILEWEIAETRGGAEERQRKEGE